MVTPAPQWQACTQYWILENPWYASGCTYCVLCRSFSALLAYSLLHRILPHCTHGRRIGSQVATLAGQTFSLSNTISHLWSNNHWYTITDPHWLRSLYTLWCCQGRIILFSARVCTLSAPVTGETRPVHGFSSYAQITHIRSQIWYNMFHFFQLHLLMCQFWVTGA